MTRRARKTLSELAADAPPPPAAVLEAPTAFSNPLPILGTHADWVALLNRAGRPILRAGLGLAAIVTALLVGSALGFAVWRAAVTGEPVPDLTAGLMPFLVALAPQAIDLVTRHREKMSGFAG